MKKFVLTLVFIFAMGSFTQGNANNRTEKIETKNYTLVLVDQWDDCEMEAAIFAYFLHLSYEEEFDVFDECMGG